MVLEDFHIRIAIVIRGSPCFVEFGCILLQEIGYCLHVVAPCFGSSLVIGITGSTSFTILEQEVFQGVETTDTLSSFRFRVFCPFQCTPVARSQNLFDTRLVEWPTVHIRVETQSIYRTEKERFTLFPWLTRFQPCFGGIFESLVRRVGAKSRYSIVQCFVLFFQRLVGRYYHTVGISRYNRVENRHFQLVVRYDFFTLVFTA